MMDIPFNSRRILIAINGLEGDIDKGLNAGWRAAGRNLQRVSRKLIIKGPKTGKYYRIKGRKRRHRASRSDGSEAPANLFGNLQKSIDYIPQGAYQMEFGADTDYARILELGGNAGRNKVSDVGKRPYLNRANISEERNTRNFLIDGVMNRLK